MSIQARKLQDRYVFILDVKQRQDASGKDLNGSGVSRMQFRLDGVRCHQTRQKLGDFMKRHQVFQTQFLFC